MAATGALAAIAVPVPVPAVISEVARVRANAWSVARRTTGRVSQRTALMALGTRVRLASR